MKHYHVVCNSPTFAYPTIITVSEEKSWKLFMQMMQFAYDVINQYGKTPEGSSVLEWTSFRGSFIDGTVIARHECHKNCIHILESEIFENVITPDHATLTRQVFYEG